MIGDPFTMVVAIILIITIGKVISSRHKAKYGILEHGDLTGDKQPPRISNTDSGAMQDEIRTLKQRIQVLERIATDNSSAADIDRQIEALREK